MFQDLSKVSNASLKTDIARVFFKRAAIPVKLPPPRRRRRRSSSGWWPPSGLHPREPVQSPSALLLICVKDRSAAGVNPYGYWVFSLVQAVFRRLANGFGPGHRLAAALEGSPHRRLPGPAATWTLEERLQRPIPPCIQRKSSREPQPKSRVFLKSTVSPESYNWT